MTNQAKDTSDRRRYVSYLELVVPRLSRCAICSVPDTPRRRVDYICAKCGLGLHGDCYLNDVASPAVRERIDDGDDVSDVEFFCPGCLS